MRMRTWYASVVAIVVVALPSACLSQASLRPSNVSKQPDKITVHCQADELIFGEAPSKAVVFVQIFGDVEELSKRPAAILDLRNDQELMARVLVAPQRRMDSLTYRIVCARSCLPHSTFSFSGAEHKYQVEFVYWCRCGELFSSKFSLMNNEVAQGDTAHVIMEITAHDDARLTFGSSSKVHYQIRNDSGNIVADGPDRLEMPSGVDELFADGETKQFRMPVFTAWQPIVSTGAVATLPPGVYEVECSVIGYEDLGLTSKLSLTVRPK